jgi:hypothetical protein
MPKLYGAPAYARPPIVPVKPVERPFDPDDLPLEAERPPEHWELGAEQAPEPWELAGPVKALPHDGAHGRTAGPDGEDGTSSSPARSFRLPKLAGRFRRDGGARP